MDTTEERPAKIRKLDVDLTEQSAPEAPVAAAEESLPTTEAAQEDTESPQAPGEPQLSKNQLKKIRRKQEWDAGREWRKQHKKEKVKAKKARKAEEDAQRIQNGEAPEDVYKKQQRKGPHTRPVQLPISLVLDCDFDELMTDKEIISLASQISRAYSDNRRSPFRSHLIISSFRGQLKSRMENELHNYHKNWKGVKFTDKDFVTAAQEAHEMMRGPQGGQLAGAFKKTESEETKNGQSSEEHTEKGEARENEQPVEQQEEASVVADTTQATEAQDEEKSSQPSIVYLSSDSDNILETLSPNTTYIIGGIVDKNRHKGICHRRAVERGIPTAKLPIGEFMEMQSRTVLATNHVVEIMLRWLEDGDWGKAFMRVIPKRKEARLRGNNQNNKDEDADEEAEILDEDEGNEKEEADAAEEALRAE